MRRTIPLLALALCAPVAAQKSHPTAPGWLTGCCEENTRKGWSEECWTALRGGTLLGSGRSGVADTVRSWEAMQILPGPDGKLAFSASPGGAARVAFPVVSQSADEIVFANPAHDYPQRVRYWRTGRTLNAEISLADGGRPMRWTYRAM